jgi:general secretion pathway protein M
MIAALKQRWAQMQERERRVLLGGAVAVALLGGYALVWDPWVQAVSGLEQDVAEQRVLLGWMKQSVSEVRMLRGSRPGGAPAAGQSLLSLIDGTARAQGLGTTMQRVEPEGNGVRVWLERAAFDDVLRWLDRLGDRGVRVTSFASERVSGQTGVVNVRLVLEGGA